MSVQVIEYNGNKKSFILSIKHKNMKKILLADDVKNRYVVVISIAGAFRKGKSFLLNFFLKYLHQVVSFNTSLNMYSLLTYLSINL